MFVGGEGENSSLWPRISCFRTLRQAAGTKFNNFFRGIVRITISSLFISQVTLGIVGCGFESKQRNPISRYS